ncbi:hypothetical protein BZA77DRAFT_319168 [Pyronema omphalodes]|nr:hypothetical protein BZA77DRAFT_319168 [Pyronema omphalodes]
MPRINEAPQNYPGYQFFTGPCIQVASLSSARFWNLSPCNDHQRPPTTLTNFRMATSYVDTSVPPPYETRGAYSSLEPSAPVVPTTIPAQQPESEIAVIHQQTWARRNRGKIISGIIIVCAVGLIFGLAFGIAYPPNRRDHKPKTYPYIGQPLVPKPVDGVTPLAAVWTNSTGARIFTQNNATGFITVSSSGIGAYHLTQETIRPNMAASSFTPLAAVAWDGGNEMRLFFFSDDLKSRTRLLQEYSWSVSTGVWTEGPISKANIQAYSQSKVAATVLPSTNQIRLYYESTTAGNIQELSYNITNNTDQKWDAINYPHSGPQNFDLSLDSGSDIAAITVNRTELRLYSVRNGNLSEMSWPYSDGVNVPIPNINWVTTTQNINKTSYTPYYLVPGTPITAVRWEGNGSANTLAFQHVLYYEVDYLPIPSLLDSEKAIEIADTYKVPQKLDTTGPIPGPGKASWKGSVFDGTDSVFNLRYRVQIIRGSKMVALTQGDIVRMYYHADDGVRSIMYNATEVPPSAGSGRWWESGTNYPHVPKNKY